MTKKISRAEKMRRYMASDPSQTVAQVAAVFGVKYATAYAVKSAMNRKPKWNTAAIVSSATSMDTVTGMSNKAMEDLFRDRTLPENIDATLAERGIKYGKFRDHAAVTYKLKNVLRDHALTHKKSFSFDQAEALDMICHKLGRIVNGDPNYADSWVDIAGYAKLVADRLATGTEV